MVKITGKTPVSKASIRKAAKAEDSADRKAAAERAPAKTVGKRQAQARGDQTPDAQRSTKAAKQSAEALFEHADTHALLGLPPGLTKEQHENNVRLAALGY